MEELTLTDPVVTTTASTKYRVVGLGMSLEAAAVAWVVIDLRDDAGGRLEHRYDGTIAADYIRYINTANFTIKSLHKRILERLVNEGVLVGTVTGAPDP